MSADADVNLVIRIEEVSSKIAELPESKASAEIIAKVASGDASAADALAAHLKKAGAKGFGATAALKAAIEDKANPAARQAGLAAYQAICDNIGSAAEPFLAPLLPAVLEQCGDKKPEVKAAAEAASKALISIINPHAVYTILGYLFECMDAKKHPATKEASLLLVKQLVGMHPKQITRALPDIVPAVSGCMNDSKQSVKDVATETMKEACTLVGNRDINAMVPLIIRSINHPEEVQETVHKLASTTFVQAVEAPALAMMVPLLLRGLRERVTAIKRKAAVVADNMAKLVDNPAEALVFLPRLMPEIEKVANEAADPELRKVSNSAIKTLQHIETEGKAKLAKTLDKGAALKTLHDLLAATAEGKKGLVPEAYPVLDYAAALCANLTNNKNFEIEEWRDKVIGTYLGVFVSKDTLAPIAQTLADKCFAEVQVKSTEYFDDEEGEELCNCEFSLAYGAKILLNNAALRLKRGRRYGLCGPNGVGKSTLMRAIANGQVDGFPPKDVLRTVYVEHDIDGSLSDLNCVEFVFADENLQAAVNTTKEQVTSMLSSVGFTEELLNKAVGSLSGGWKMKLALARTMLMKPDIMLLDEPTNHLDAESVAWLERFLADFKGTVVAVTHDRYFLDNVAGWILELDRGAGIPFEGNYSEWLGAKAKRITLEAKQQAALDKAIGEELDWINKKAKGQQKKGQARMRRYDELVAQQAAYVKAAQLDSITIPQGPRLGDLVLDVESLKKSFEDRLLIDEATFSIPPGACVGIIGGNGAGKSTLFRMIMKQQNPDGGSLRLGDTVVPMYVDQSRDSLAGDKTVYEEIADGKDEVDLGGRLINARAYCSWYNFKGGDQQKKVGSLSGGERNRLHLAKTLKQAGNLLLLDEPTNDLDVDTLRCLEEAILNFAGTTLLISHDRWFLDRVATHILAFEGDSKLHFFAGGYSDYEEDRKRRTGSTFAPQRLKFRKLAA